MARGTRSKGLQKARRKTPSKTKSQSQIALEKEYKRLRKNLQQKVRYYRQKGMLLYDDIIPTIPKKITPSSVKRLQNIDVRKKALKGERIDLETGEIIGVKPSKKALETLSQTDNQRQMQKAIEENRQQLEEKIEQRRAYEEQKKLESQQRQEYYSRIQNMLLYGTDIEELIALSNAYEEIEVFPENLATLVTSKLDSLINEHGALKVGHAVMQMGSRPFHEKMQNKAQSYLDNINDFFTEILNHLNLSDNEMEEAMQEIDELEGGYDTEYDY